MKLDPAKHDPAGNPLDQIDDLVDHLARLAQSDVRSSEFYPELLSGAVRAMAAVAGAVWTPDGDGRLQLAYQLNLAQARLDENSKAASRHARLIDHAMQLGKASLFPASHPQDADAPLQNPTELLIVLSPLVLDGQRLGLVEIFQRSDTPPDAQRGCLHFLSTIAELAVDYERHRRLRELRAAESLWGEFAQFARSVHGSLELDRTVYAIANEGRRLIGCDRASVVIFRRKRCRLRAVSGVDTFDPRSNSVRLLEKLVKLCVAVDQPLWHTGALSGHPPELEEPLSEYLDQSGARRLAIVPLHKPSTGDADRQPRQQDQILGALVVEQFDGRWDEGIERRVAAICGHSEVALSNALDYRSVPFLPLLRWLGRARWFAQARQLPKTLLAVLLLGGLISALIFVPADFSMRVDGQLNPQLRRDVFAPTNGVVDRLFAQHDQAVAPGDVLIQLRDPELEFEFRRIEGEIQTARTRLAAVKAARVEGRRRGAAENEERGEDLSAEQEELEAQLTSLDRQHQNLVDRKQALSIRSPIAGKVVTWNVDQLLEARPVERGQALLTVAQIDGPWVVDLDVPDDQMGHVLDAQRELGSDLAVTFMLATDPGVTYRAQIEQTALATEARGEERPSTRVIVVIPPEADLRHRPGATATAQIHCGRRSVGYVWLHDLIDAIKSRWTFYF